MVQLASLADKTLYVVQAGCKVNGVQIESEGTPEPEVEIFIAGVAVGSLSGGACVLRDVLEELLVGPSAFFSREKGGDILRRLLL